MINDRRFSRGGYSGILALVVMVICLLVGNCIFAAEQASASEGASYKFFPLKHISVEQGEKYLGELVAGTITHFPGTSTLLVTAQPSELTRAQVILDLVDSPDQFVIQKILPLSAARKIPSNEQIAAKLSPSLTRGISIGNLSDPPSVNASAKAIIDIHHDAVIAIAPAGLLQRIVTAIEPLPNADSTKEPDTPKTPEKSRASSKQKVSVLNEPNEARFLLAANGTMNSEPNAVAAASEQDTSEPPAAGPAYEPAPIANGDKVVNLALADRQKLTVAELLGLAGPYLQLDFMYDEKDVTQEVTLNPHGKFSGPIKINDLYSLLEEVLKFKGLAMTRGKGNLVTIVPVGNALDIDPTFLETDKGRIERGDGIVQQVFVLKHIDISSAQNLLTGMKLTTSITPIPETKTLIVTGYAHRMPRIQTLLNIVDKPGEPKKFRFRPLRYTMAQTLAPKLQTLAEQLGTISITVAETAATAAPTTPSKQRPGETTAQYQARLRAEAAARARQLASMRAAGRTTTPQQPEPSTPTVYLDADERTNRILMIGLAEQLDDVEELIDTLDVAQQDLRTLELYKIEYVDAEEARKKLEELGVISPSSTTDSMRITGGAKPATTTAKPPVGATAAARGIRTGEETESLVEEPQVVVIEPTNSLLANATAEQHTRISRILAYVDSETDKEEIPYKLYPLENQSPQHLSEVLEKLIQETVQDPEGKIQQVVPKQDEQITIVPDPNTFSLIVYASKKNQEWISNLIEQLDKRRPQVLIDCTLVEVSKTDTFEYDLNVIQSFPDLVETSGLIPPIMGSSADSTGSVDRLLSSSRDRFVDVGADGGAGVGFYGDVHINALLTAMETKEYGRVLAKPKVLVNDNEKGTIETTETTYVEKTGSTVVEGVQGTVQTSVDYTPYDAGITLEIIPHISQGDLLRLDITLSRSDFLPTIGEKPPNTVATDITTTVTVPDGSTIILGGMLKLNQSKSGTKIPLLGDLPLVGGLFRSIGNSDLQKKLYIFVKAEVLRPDETLAGVQDLERISERNRVAFEEFEDKFQKYEDWPGIEPKPVEPVKVLDAQ
ncbi:MAG: hypothetical protein JSW66_00175 [Phycisphaerales bacterium]|nr:MAG: hypothetical protein JSW66_00175 [Phycisphaerales bacterium]